MPKKVMRGMYQQIPRIRRERMMDMAEAAAVPGWIQSDRKRWWDRQMQATAAARPQPKGGTWMPFTWNGQWVGKDALKANLAQTQGSAFSQ